MFDLEIMYLSIPTLLCFLVWCLIRKAQKEKKNKVVQSMIKEFKAKEKAHKKALNKKTKKQRNQKIMIWAIMNYDMGLRKEFSQKY